MQGKLFKSALVMQVASGIKIETKAKCPFGYDSPSQNAAQTDEQTVQTEDVQYIEQMFADSLEFSQNFTTEDYESIAQQIWQKYDSLPVDLAAHHNPRASLVSCVLRTAGHDFMDFRPDHEHEGGSDGCINFSDPDNQGLQQCLTKFGIPELFEEYAHKVSLADFLVIIAEAGMARTHRSFKDDDMSLANSFRDGFKWGRRSIEQCDWNEGRMPNPEHGCHGLGEGKEGLEQIFVDNIYKGRKDAWTMVAAISGAHTVGGAHKEFSGYNGWWSDVENQGLFNNDYYYSLVAKGWGPELKVDDNEGKNQWQRVDIPHEKTIEQLKKDKLSAALYAAQEAALLDPKRGLFEKPLEGIQGHHEFMLTTDICLAMTRNTAVGNCFSRKGTFGDVDKVDITSTQHGNECRQNFWREIDYKQLFPQDDCCAWTKVKNLYNLATWSYTTMGTEWKRFCNVDVQWTRPTNETCCQAMGSKMGKNCGEVYWGGGPAFEDIAEFARDEDIWIRKYLEAWHHATENGSATLTWLQGESIGEKRHDLEAKHKVNCRGLSWTQCTETPECHDVTVGMAPARTQHWNKACRNKHLLVTEQQKDHETFRNYEDTYMHNLKNPKQSSDLSALYPAENALARQNRDPEETDEMKNTAYHPFLHQRKNEETTGTNAGRFQTSCSITQPVSADQPISWWQADFIDGEQEISGIELWGEIYKVMWDRAYFGTKVYIGDQLCAEITTKTETEPYRQTKDSVTQRMYGNGYQVFCDAPVTGSFVRIESTRSPLDTDLYKSGLAVCDVKVFDSSREPLFWNDAADMDHRYERNKVTRPEHEHWDVPLAQHEIGIKYPHKFVEAGYVLE